LHTFFLGKVGGLVYDLDLVKVNHSLVKAIKLSVATRRLIGKGLDGYKEIQDIEREIREAAGECQRVLGLIKADEKRALLSNLGG